MYLVQGKLNCAKDASLAMRSAPFCEPIHACVAPCAFTLRMASVLCQAARRLAASDQRLNIHSTSAAGAGCTNRAGFHCRWALHRHVLAFGSHVAVEGLAFVAGSLWDNLTLGNATAPEPYVWELVRPPISAFCALCSIAPANAALRLEWRLAALALLCIG